MARKNVSREKILSAAERMFAERGYYAANMEEIAAEAGVAKGTLYYNFPRKAALFLTVVKRGIEDLIDRVNRVTEAEKPFVQMFDQILRVQVDMLFDYPRIAAILFRELSAGLEEEIRNGLEELRRRYVEFIARLLRDGEREGFITILDSDLAAYSLIELVYAACNRRINTGGSRENVHSFLRVLLTQGLVKEN